MAVTEFESAPAVVPSVQKESSAIPVTELGEVVPRVPLPLKTVNVTV